MNIKLKGLTATLLIAVTFIWLLLASMTSQAADVSALLPVVQPGVIAQTEPLPTATPVIGKPCTQGAQFSTWGVCLHGKVIIDGNTPEHVQITVTNGISNVTSETIRHPNGVISYSLDLSVLEPEFLDPVTLTASYNGRTTQRQLFVFPDFRDHNQQFDINLDSDPGQGSAFWGYVYNYEDEAPVAASFKITVEHNGVTLTLHPQISSDSKEPYPYYKINNTALGVTPGEAVTLTVGYGDIRTYRIVTVTNSSQQINFLLGWKCGSTSVLPRGGGHFGSPRGGGHFGTPDEACIWGYGSVENVPTAGINIFLEINGQPIGYGVTQRHLGEELPRYGIVISDVERISNSPITVIGIYSGSFSSQVVTLNVGLKSDQQLNVNLNSLNRLNKFNGNNGKKVAWLDGYLWTATQSGVIRWNPNDGSHTKLMKTDGLISNSVSAIYADHTTDTLWFGTDIGANSYRPSTNQWTTLSISDGLQVGPISAIAIDLQGNIWFGGTNGVSRYDPTKTGNEAWINFLGSPSLHVYNVTDIAIDSNNETWVVTYGYGVSRFDPKNLNTGNPPWTNFTTSNSGLGSNILSSVATDSSGRLWFGHDTNDRQMKGAISRFDPNAPTSLAWLIYTKQNSSIVNDNSGVSAIAVDEQGRVWVADGAGIVHRYDDLTQTWTIIGSEPIISDISFDSNGNPWLGTGHCGIKYYNVVNSQWQSFVTKEDLSLFDDPVIAIASDTHGSFWFGTDCNGVIQWNSVAKTWQFFTLADITGIESTEGVISINADEGDYVWIGLAGGGLAQYSLANQTWQSFTSNNSGLLSNVVSDLKVRNNVVWIGTASGLNRYFISSNTWQSTTYDNTNGGLINNYITKLQLDDKGVWIGTLTGLSYLDLQSGLWQTYTVESTNSGLVDNYIAALAIGTDGKVWIGSSSKGLSVYDPIHKTWQKFAFGDSWDYISNISIDPNGDIWAATSAGILYYDTFKQKWIQRNDVTAVESIGFYSGGQMWVGARTDALDQWQILLHGSDLSIQIQSNSRSVFATTETVIYTVTVRNLGDRTAEATTLSLHIPTENIISIEDSLPQNKLGFLKWSLGSLSTATTPVTVTIKALLKGNSGENVAVTAQVTTTSREPYTQNNTVTWNTVLRDPRPDVRVALAGPPVLKPGNDGILTAWIDNVSGLIAENVHLHVKALSSGLTIRQTDITIPRLKFGDPPWRIDLPASLATDVASNQPVVIQAQIDCLCPQGEVTTSNNTVIITIPTSLDDRETLILVAGQQMAERQEYGASPVLGKLYELAQQPEVKGAVIDVQAVSHAVRDAYIAWNHKPSDNALANQIATIIQQAISDYRRQYKHLHYVVIVGGDNIIPFYRVADRSDTYWDEQSYAKQFLPPGTVHDALFQDKLLTDDFYTDLSPTLPRSKQWESKKLPFYQAELTSGRLVETPDEIDAVIDAFITNHGGLELQPSAVGGDEFLTLDMVNNLCQETLPQGGLTPEVCNANLTELRNAFKTLTSGVLWSGQHANHYSMGDVGITDITQRSQLFSQNLIFTIGCHAGLNVPASPGNLTDVDLVQSFLGRGGTTIGSTAYAFASIYGPYYSEEFLINLAKALVNRNGQALGDAFNAAKHQYFAQHEISFDPADEKVLAPLTLYGLPMLHIKVPNAPVTAIAAESAQPLTSMVSTTTVSDIAVTLDPALFNCNHPEVNTLGEYCAYNDQTLAQAGWPVQPIHHVSITTEVDGKTPHGLVLRNATYIDAKHYDPVIGQPWAIGELPSDFLNEPPAAITKGWDWQLPHSLGYYADLTDTQSSQSVASINLILGACDVVDDGSGKIHCATERHFDNFVFDVNYSASDDHIAPTITVASGYNVNNKTILHVQAIDDGSDVTKVIGVCDNDTGRYDSIELQHINGAWEGECGEQAARFYVQAVDGAGNVAESNWALGLPWSFSTTMNADKLFKEDSLHKTVPYTLTLVNEQDTPVTLTLTYSSPWTVSLSTNTVTNLISHKSEFVQVFVQTPDTVATTQTATTLITVVSVACVKCPGKVIALITSTAPTALGEQPEPPIALVADLPNKIFLPVINAHTSPDAASVLNDLSARIFLPVINR